MSGSTFAGKLLSRRTSRMLLTLVALLVLALSMIPRPEMVLGRFNAYDKLGHFLAYVALGFFAMRAISRRGPLPYLAVGAACALFGGIIELVQPLVGRNRELVDFLVDLAGAIVGAVLAAIVGRGFRTREERGARRG